MTEEDKKDQKYDASKIQVLEGLEAVKKRPGMYIGGTGLEGLHHLIWEVVDNAIDEAMAGACTKIDVVIHKDNSVTVSDNGRGIPVERHKQTGKSALETVLTVLHAGGKFGGGGYKVSGGLHGVGVSVVNALSTNLRAEIHRDGKSYVQEYKNGGKPVGKVKLVGKAKDTGTTITFSPDPNVFEDINFSYNTVLDRLRQQAYLTKGVHIKLSDERSGQKYSYYFEGGIKSYVEHLNHNKETVNKPPFYVEKMVEKTNIEISIQYTNSYTENVQSFANNILTPEGGTHITGFRTSLTRCINDYAKKYGLLKDADGSLTGDDVREGLSAVISVKLTNPQFEGQTKAKLGNPEIQNQVSQVVTEYLSYYLEENPNEAKNIIAKCSLSARARMAARAARDTVIRKGALEGMTLPGKLADCSSKDASKSELYIVEGDSAGGCFSGDVKVALTDGRSLSFKELLKEDSQGKINYCYTIRENGLIGIEKIRNPRKTKSKTEVIKVVLDNGEEIICTPGHQFMLRDGSYQRAVDLIKGDSLMPLYRQYSRLGKRITIKGYEMVFDPSEKRWIFTHLLADDYNLRNRVYNKEGSHRHHIDFNKLNNNPDNVIRMNDGEHLELHRKLAALTIHTKEVKEKCKAAHLQPEYRAKISRIMSTPEMKKMLKTRAKKQWENEDYKEYMTKKFLDFYWSNAEYREQSKHRLNSAQKKYWANEENAQEQSERVRKYFDEHPEKKEELRELAKKQWKDKELLALRRELTKIQWTDEFRAKRKKAYNKTYLKKALLVLNNLYQEEKEINKELYDQARGLINDKALIKYETICERFFEGNEEKLKEAAVNFNHRVKAVIPLKEKMDVYDIEISGTHNFALESGVFVHNSAKQGRDRIFQAILPLKGKILNVEKARIDKVLSFEEIKALIIALGAGIGEQYDISKIRYHRIIIMTDADVDGAHIRTLLLTFFYRNFPEIIDLGYLYIAQPPLYVVSRGKEKHYVYSDEERDEVLKKLGASTSADIADANAEQAEEESALISVTDESAGVSDEVSAESASRSASISGSQKVSIQRYKGLGEMNPELLWETTMNPESRILLQVKSDDAERADEVFSMLMGDAVEPRKKFIQTHAAKVKNLDI